MTTWEKNRTWFSFFGQKIGLKSGDYYSYQIIAIGLSCIVILDSCNFFYSQLLTYVVSIDEAYDDKKKVKKRTWKNNPMQ